MRVRCNKLLKLSIDKRMNKERKCDVGDLIEILPDEGSEMEAQS